MMPESNSQKIIRACTISIKGVKSMKAVIAIDSFKGSLTSLEAGNSVAAGIRRVFPDAECIIRPLADGGEGTVDALVAA